MSFASSQQHHVPEWMHKRNLVAIPKDQKELLESQDSWAVELKDTPYGSIAVPAHVLVTVKEAFIYRQKQNNQQASVQETTAPLLSTEKDEEQHLPPRETTPAATVRTTVASSPEHSIPWSPSPSRSQQRVNISVELPSVRDSPKIRDVASQIQSVQQLQTAQHSAPPSSYAEEDELEMELPQAQETRDIPVNREAYRMQPPSSFSQVASTAMTTATTNTPPCAQPDASLIAETTAGGDSVPSAAVSGSQVAQRRRRRMKPINFSDESPVVTRTSIEPSALTRMPSTKAFPAVDTWNSTSSSSIIAATQQGRTNQSSFPDSTLAGKTQRPTKIQLEPNIPAIPNQEIPSSIGPVDQHAEHQQIHNPAHAAVNHPMQPYTAFISTYPDYVTSHSGNLWHFVQACVCLQFLQAERALREYLYDDFIRAFSSGFLPYVRNAGPLQEPLPAIEWFNMLKGPILFNRMSVTHNSLEWVLSSYPEEVARAMVIIKAGGDEEKMMNSIPQRVMAAEDALDVSEVEESPPPGHAPPSVQTLDLFSPLLKKPAPPIPHQPPQRPPPRAASPELGSDAIEPPPQNPPHPDPHPSASSVVAATPISSTPRPSAYLERLVSNTHSVLKRKRSVEEQARLREHFRKRKSGALRSLVSPRVEST